MIGLASFAILYTIKVDDSSKPWRTEIEDALFNSGAVGICNVIQNISIDAHFAFYFK
jgi:hypothetical protein